MSREFNADEVSDEFIEWKSADPNFSSDKVSTVIPPCNESSTSNVPAPKEIRKSRFKAESDQNVKETTVLEPDHPLLEKFQKALKDHLERQIIHLKEDLFELETNIKKKNVAKDDLGLKLYESQQLVSKQQTDLEALQKEMETLHSTRMENEESLKELKSTYNNQRVALDEAERKELELRDEVESINFLENEISKFECDLDSELAVNQRIAEKTMTNRKILAEEKRKLDLFIYRLNSEVIKFENEIENMDMQMRVKEFEREELSENVSNFNMDLEILTREHSKLIQSWNAVIVAIAQRDKALSEGKDRLRDLGEKRLTMMNEIEGLKKLNRKEMKDNEMLTLLKDRIVADMYATKQSLEDEYRKKTEKESKLNEYNSMIYLTEYDYSDIVQKNNKLLQDKGKNFHIALEKLSLEKAKIEAEIVDLLQDRLTNSQAAKYLNKVVKNLQTKNREMEITLSCVENSNAKVLVEIEKQTGINEEYERYLAEYRRKLTDLDKSIEHLGEQKIKAAFQVSKKQRELDTLYKKIGEIMEKTNGIELSPLEMKIRSLELLIEDTKLKIAELQKFWLRQQGHIVLLSEKRYQQVQDMNLLRKQLLIVEQKNLKIEDELQKHKKKGEEMSRLILKLQSRLTNLNLAIAKSRGEKEGLDKENSLVQCDAACKLEENELELLTLEATIMDLEEEKVQLTSKLVEVNREALGWEKKITIASETRDTIKRAKSQSGDVFVIKSEIHRMNVRFTQLKKAQDKLVADFEHCISRRDAILSQSEARERKQAGGHFKTRINFKRKIEELRSKIKSMNEDFDRHQRSLDEFMKTETLLKGALEESERSCKIAESSLIESEQNVEHALNERIKLIEFIVYRQRLSQARSALEHRSYRFQFRNIDALKMEYSHVLDMNNKLYEITDCLRQDFPNHPYLFDRVLNTLLLPKRDHL